MRPATDLEAARGVHAEEKVGLLRPQGRRSATRAQSKGGAQFIWQNHSLRMDSAFTKTIIVVSAFSGRFQMPSDVNLSYQTRNISSNYSKGQERMKGMKLTDTSFKWNRSKRRAGDKSLLINDTCHFRKIPGFVHITARVCAFQRGISCGPGLKLL